MKLFNTENGKEVVYVQIQDILILKRSDMHIPESVYAKVSKEIIVDKDSDFLKFDDEHEVKFFKKLDFIVDYDKYKDKTDEQLDKELEKKIKLANQLAEKCYKLSKDEREKNINLLQEYENTLHMILSMKGIYEIRYHKKAMPFPENP